MTPRHPPRVRSLVGSGKEASPLPNLFLGFPVSRSKFAEVAGRPLGAALPFDDFYHQTLFESIDGFQQVITGTGDIIISQSSVELYVDAVINDRASIKKSPSTAIVALSWDKQRTFRVSLGFESNNDSTVNFWLSTGDILSASGFGLYVDLGKVYARTVNTFGTTDVEIADLGLSGYFQKYVLKIVFTPTVDCKFYLDGVLKATITTNLPTGTTDSNKIFQAIAKNLAATDTGSLYIYESDLFQKA